MKSLINKIIKEGKSIYDLKISALEKVNMLLKSGGPNNITFSNAEIEFLNQTVITNIDSLYRGLYLMNFRVEKDYKTIINSLNIGDELPSFLFKKYNLAASYSKKESVAKRYSKDGNVSIIIKIENIPNNAIIVDTTNLSSLIKKDKELINQDIFDQDSYKYMKNEAEVIIDETKLISKPIIISKTGLLR